MTEIPPRLLGLRISSRRYKNKLKLCLDKYLDNKQILQTCSLAAYMCIRKMSELDISQCRENRNYKRKFRIAAET